MKACKAEDSSLRWSSCRNRSKELFAEAERTQNSLQQLDRDLSGYKSVAFPPMALFDLYHHIKRSRT